MKKYLAVIISAAIGTFIAQTTAAENCQFHKIEFLTDTFKVIDDPLPGFDICGIGRVVGTINGQITSCVILSDLVPGNDIWGDGDFRFFAVKFFDVFETKDGTFQVDELGMLDFDTGFQSTMLDVTGGTGAYEGATGLLTMGPKWPNRGDVQLFQGEICMP